MSKGFASNYRIVLLATGLLACFGILGVRLYFLHVVDRQEWLDTIDRARRQVTVEKARRGDILDARGGVLATSRSLIVLGVDPHAVVDNEKERAKWSRLAQLIDLPEAEVRTAFTTKFRAPVVPAAKTGNPEGLVFKLGSAPAANSDEASDEDGDGETDAGGVASGPRPIRWKKLREDLTEEVFAEVKKLAIKGVTGDRVYRRVYPNQQLAAHVIGYVNKAERPASGMEAFADFYLRGQNGWRIGERDGRGRELAQFRTRDVPHADGYSVRLSIDTRVQDVVEQELNFIGQKFQPLKATIVVSDPRTGFVLGMANYPSFNLNEYNKVPKEEAARMKNVAVTDVYEPGSVFKIVAAAGALEERLATRDTRFNCMVDRIEYRGDKLANWGRMVKLPGDDHHFSHDLSVAEIIAHSSNRGAAHLGMKLGEERLYRYARAFGFGSKLGFPVGGEVTGDLKAPKNWDGLTITRLPMGHAVSCTVLQMHQAMSVIANGGLLLQPQLVREIHDAAGESVYSYRPVVLGRAVSDDTARKMAQMLMGVASKDGTAPEAAIPGFEVAGKTGTTQKIIEGKYSERHHVASFVGFFPASAPQVVISVIVDDADAHAPNGVAYGKTVAAPSFKKIGEKLIPILDIKPTVPAARLPLLAANEGGRR